MEKTDPPPWGADISPAQVRHPSSFSLPLSLSLQPPPPPLHLPLTPAVWLAVFVIFFLLWTNTRMQFWLFVLFFFFSFFPFRGSVNLMTFIYARVLFSATSWPWGEHSEVDAALTSTSALALA